MKAIVISDPGLVVNETETVNRLFEAGLSAFHLRKPDFSSRDMRNYLSSIEAKYLNRIIIHSNHLLAARFPLAGIHLTEKHRLDKYRKSSLTVKYLKFIRQDLMVTTGYHTLGSLKAKNQGYAYVFLSPVFESISKIGYRGSFNEDSLQKAVMKADCKVVAMGGIDEDKIGKAAQLGFYGVALLGAIWKAPDPIEKFQRILQLCAADVTT